ncbi:MAG: HlyC/CorC family transporter [Spirochaetales bacterium]|nr:HlyC/CorC family transporter [Spirochaetales bacterium]
MKLFWTRKRSARDTDVVDQEALDDLNGAEKEMIRGIVELSDTSAKEIMVPRIDVVFIPEDLSYDELIARILETGHSRFPIYKDTIDDVTGILYVKDLLIHIIRGNEISIPQIMRKAYFVPESMKLDVLLRELKERKVHIAVAVDEYGGTSGMVFMEDIIEEIVGDIQDEFDNEDEEIVQTSDNSWLCDARLNMEDVNDEMGWSLPTEDYDTLGGFVFSLFGKIPVRNEKIVWENYSFIIQSVDGHKIKKIKIEQDGTGGSEES